ncbi:MAG: hypothetical protein NTZ83_01480 [Candidatus Pacearchaeota archaeon]|nr:hypothetical protein [Candidatus Pacearchaeota archaeon]
MKKRVQKEKKLAGIHGWLLLYVIFLLLGISSVISNLALTFSKGSIIMVLIEVINLVLILNSLILIFKYSKKAILWNIYMLIFEIITILIILIFFRSQFNFIAGVIIIFAMLYYYAWIRYWQLSKRVKNTFVKN